MTRRQGQRLNLIALSQHRFGRRCRATGGRHPWHNLKVDPGGLQRGNLFRTARKYPRITTFQPDHALPVPRCRHQYIVNLCLWPTMRTGLFAHVNSLGITPRKFQNAGIDQTVVENHIRFLQPLNPAQCDQVLGTRTGTYQ